MENRSFMFDGKIVAMQRPRTAKNGHVYVPLETKRAEMDIRKAYERKYKGCAPLTGAVKIEIQIFRHMTKEIAKSKKKVMDVQYGLIKPATKPDLSNMIKTVEDALNGVAYRDDAQITSIKASKRYCYYPLEMDYANIIISQDD